MALLAGPAAAQTTSPSAPGAEPTLVDAGEPDEGLPAPLVGGLVISAALLAVGTSILLVTRRRGPGDDG